MTKIRHLNSTTPGNMPPPLETGQLAINHADAKLFVQNPSDPSNPYEFWSNTGPKNILVEGSLANGPVFVRLSNLVEVGLQANGTNASAYIAPVSGPVAIDYRASSFYDNSGQDSYTRDSYTLSSKEVYDSLVFSATRETSMARLRIISTGDFWELKWMISGTGTRVTMVAQRWN